MTRLTDTRPLPSPSGPAEPPPAAGTGRRSLTDILADPRIRLGLGTAAVLATGLAARGNRVGPCEAKTFRLVNGWPDALYRPAWVIMQLGALGAAPAVAGAAWLAGDRDLAGPLLAGGTGTWALSKLVKRVVHRPRPTTLLAGTRCRGPAAAGLGYLSGHAGVSVALGTAVLPRLGRVGRAVTLSVVPVVGISRVYVGAHLPLDVVGGAALGLAVDAGVALIGPQFSRAAPPRRRSARARDIKAWSAWHTASGCGPDASRSR